MCIYIFVVNNADYQIYNTIVNKVEPSYLSLNLTSQTHNNDSLACMNFKFLIDESKAIICILESRVFKIELKFRTPSIQLVHYPTY